MTPEQAIEQIRAALHALEGHPDEERVLAALWHHLQARRPVSVISLGAAFEANPTQPKPAEPPQKKLSPQGKKISR